ncbi:apolipoprotein N-acyltransferase [Flavobacteriaceae bacterium Ap0902]|nr:apolipoprotein N-acyltransferase [Flavobacteriaceae bacterium Ap0902]
MWKSILLSIISGLLLVLSWPTYGFAGLLFIAFVPLLIIEKQFSDAPFKYKSLRIFLLSFITFLIWNALTYTWLAQARPQIDPSASEIQQAWFAYAFAVIMNALFMAIVFITYHFIRRKQGNFFGFIFLPAFWMTFEKLHLNWDFSWPWLNLGNGFASYYQWVQWYDITGTFGGTLWVWICNLLIFKAILLYLEHGNQRTMQKYFAGFALAVLIPIGASYMIYYNYEEKGEEIEVAVIQPELEPYREKYNKSGQEIVAEIIKLGDDVNLSNTDLIITPETSFPGLGQIYWNDIQHDPYINQFRNWLQKYPKLVLIAGTDVAKITRAVEAPNITAIPLDQNVWANRYNAAIQLENNIDSIPRHDKSKLVVGVEYFPYPATLKPILGSFMLDFGGNTNSLTKAKESTVLTNHQNSAAVVPLICYESIYGEYTANFIKKGGNLITISTNDSWWGNTEGHRQLLAYARLRAIENRRSIARAANSGISGFINQRGDLMNSLPYDTQGSAKHPLKLNTEQTDYTYAGDLIARIALLISGILLAYYIAEKFIGNKKET